MTKSTRLETDPNPDCEHDWLGIGWTTICEPPIFHSACFECRTFKHVQDPGGRGEPGVRTEHAVEHVFYSKVWISGPWNWIVQANKSGRIITLTPEEERAQEVAEHWHQTRLVRDEGVTLSKEIVDHLAAMLMKYRAECLDALGRNEYGDLYLS